MNDTLLHLPVMRDEVLAAFKIDPSGVYVDATFGRGGHSECILENLGPDGRLLVMDKDHQAIGEAQKRFSHDQRVMMHHGSFNELALVANKLELTGKIAGILLDLGVSSPQLDDAGRGFSFLRDGPLDMRMDQRSAPNAAEYLQAVTQIELEKVLKTYGEERYAKRISRAICEQQKISPITTTAQLAQIVAEANPSQERNKHPATRTFQALRIIVNNELADLKSALQQSMDCLAINGRLVVISFHSLEDRITKEFIRENSTIGDFPRRMPIPESAKRMIRLRKLGKKKATVEEVKRNPRSRSAMLRIAEKVA